MLSYFSLIFFRIPYIFFLTIGRYFYSNCS